MVFGQEVGEGLVGKLLKAAPSLLPEQVNRGPGLGVEFEAFTNHFTAPWLALDL